MNYFAAINHRLTSLLSRMPVRSRGILTTSAYGLGAGISAVGFQLGINWLYQFGLVRLSHQSTSVFVLGSFAIVIVSSLIVGWLLNSFCREAAGSGVPQLKLAFWKDFGFVPVRVVWVKFLAGILSIGGGSSLGREGPSVQLAGAVGSNLAQLAGEPKQNRRAPAAAGAAAGLAAAFNTPLAATTFVLEEVIGDLNSRFLGPILLASVIGALVVHGTIGKQPSFKLTGVDSPTWIGYALTPVVAAVASLVGVYFQRFSLGLRQRAKAFTMVPKWIVPSLGAALTWSIGTLIFLSTGHLGVFSLGYDDLSGALAGDIGWQLAGVLLASKLIATVACYGLGGCGGIFSPTLFFGGMTGTLIAGLVGIECNISHSDALTLSIVGMSACLGAVVFAPVTGILIVFEMTHEFALVPALMLAALVSQAISRGMNGDNFYDSLLKQDGHLLEHVRPPRDLQSWHQLPVSAIANFSPAIIPLVSPHAIDTVLKSHPYRRFPVVRDGRIEGVLTRKEFEISAKESRPPTLLPAVTCLRTDTVQKLQRLLIESNHEMVLVLDRADGNVIGLVTLHDLLRAENSIADSAETGT
jgi:CIC family chloride channel protein